MKKIYMKLAASVLSIMMSLTMIVGATFAWLVLSQSPVVNGINIAIGGGKTILLAPDLTEMVTDAQGKEVAVHYPGRFTNSLEFAEYDTYDYLNDNSHIPPELSTFYIQSWWRKTDNRKEANLYFLPYSSKMSIPKEVSMPQIDSDGLLMVAFLRDRPIGLLSLGKEDGTTGKVLGMSLLQQLTGRYYADQFLGCAVSHFRKKGCKDLQLLPGDYPDDVANRYAFDPQTWQRSFEEHREYAYSAQQLVVYLKAAGFTSIAVYGDRTFDPPSEGEQRIYLKARKGKIK